MVKTHADMQKALLRHIKANAADLDAAVDAVAAYLQSQLSGRKAGRCLFINLTLKKNSRAEDDVFACRVLKSVGKRLNKGKERLIWFNFGVPKEHQEGRDWRVAQNERGRRPRRSTGDYPPRQRQTRKKATLSQKEWFRQAYSQLNTDEQERIYDLSDTLLNCTRLADFAAVVMAEKHAFKANQTSPQFWRAAVILMALKIRPFVDELLREFDRQEVAAEVEKLLHQVRRDRMPDSLITAVQQGLARAA